MRLLAKGKGQVVGLNRVIKLSHTKKARVEQKLKNEHVTQRDTKEKNTVGRRSNRSKGLKQESACEEQGGQDGWMRVSKRQESGRQGERG